MDTIVRNLLEGYQRKAFKPYLMELRISHTCNLDCIHCSGYNDIIDHENPLSKEQWISVIRQAAALGVQECMVIADKEPFTNTDILDFKREIKELGMYGKTTTNGTLLSEDAVKTLIEIGWDCINISLDGPDAESNDCIRGERTFERVVENLRRLKELKTGETPQIIFNTVVHRRMFEKIPRMIELAAELDVSTVDFQPLSVWFPSLKDMELTEDQVSGFNPIIAGTRELAEKNDIQTNIDIFLQRKWEEDKMSNDGVEEDGAKEERESFFALPCYLPWYFISVQEDGRVNPCHTLDSGEENVKEKSLKEIWEGGYFEQVRRRMISKDFFERCIKNCCVMQAANHSVLAEKLQEEIKNG